MLVSVPVLSALLAVHVTDPQSKVEILKNVILLVVVKGVLGVAVTVVTWSPILLEAEIPLVVNEMVTSGYPVAVQFTVRSPPGDCVPSVGRDAVGATRWKGVGDVVIHNATHTHVLYQLILI